MFVTLVKAIRADKSGAYDNLLTDAAKKIISVLILASGWYPYETYRKCLNAAAEVIAKGDMEVCRQWGREQAEETMTSVYKRSIQAGNPQKALEMYGGIHKRLFDFGEMHFDLISDHEIVLYYTGFEADFKPFYCVARGWMERFMELVMGKNVKSEFLEKSWEGADQTRLKINW